MTEKKRKKIVMLDMDKTLIDEQYQTNADFAAFLFTFLAEHPEIILVPNSDTPLPRLKAAMTEITGIKEWLYVIAEKGLVVEINGQTYYTQYVSRNSLVKPVEEIAGMLAENYGFIVRWCDSTNVIRERQRLPRDSFMMLVDEQREQSFGFFLKKTDGQGLPHNFPADQFGNFCKEVPCIVPGFLQPLDMNPAYGIVIGKLGSADKTLGFNLIRNYFGDCSYYMVGDSMPDLIHDDKVTHCAVENSTREFAVESNFLSELTYTEGAIECLKWIARQ